jgi:glycosyltransferase involved in cell wall biosynthesis
LLVSTYNNPVALELTLGSVLRQSRLPDEVLVADDGSGAETRAVVERATADFEAQSIGVRHLWHEDDGFRLAAARNRALGAARSEYVVQIDGDVLLHRRFLEEHLRFAASGYFLTARRVNLSPVATERIKRDRPAPPRLGYRDFVNRGYAIHLPWLTPLTLWIQAKSYTKGILGSNLSYWLDDARAVNGYDEAFRGWGKEDNEFVLRLMNRGVRRRTLFGSALQYHLHHPQSPLSLLDENTRYLRASAQERRVWARAGMVKDER